MAADNVTLIAPAKERPGLVILQWAHLKTEIRCNECGLLICNVPTPDLQRMLTKMELKGDVASAICQLWHRPACSGNLATDRFCVRRMQLVNSAANTYCRTLFSRPRRPLWREPLGAKLLSASRLTLSETTFQDNVRVADNPDTTIAKRLRLAHESVQPGNYL